MGKIAQVSSKYIINAQITAEGIVDKPDVIGAVFGQTEGLLGAELELRELQRSGRIGRIEVNIETRSGKSTGTITIPSSLDKAETSIVAAALEIIERIGPCDAKIKIQGIEDVRISKRTFVVERAKELLRQMQTKVLPDSQEIANEVASSVRVMEIQEFGKDRLPAGPAVTDADEVIIVEGRADVITMLKYGFKNVIAVNGTSVPDTIIDVCREKTVTVFVDGDRGGNLILKSLFECAELDFVTRAPAGKEVEELTQKEIHKALRARITAEQVKLELTKESNALNNENRQMSRPSNSSMRPMSRPSTFQRPTMARPGFSPSPAPVARKVPATPVESKAFAKMLEEMVGTHGACILDEKLNILGKVPMTELGTTVKSLSSGVHAIVLDGPIDAELVSVAERTQVKFVVGTSSAVKPEDARVTLLTADKL